MGQLLPQKMDFEVDIMTGERRRAGYRWQAGVVISGGGPSFAVCNYDGDGRAGGFWEKLDLWFGFDFEGVSAATGDQGERGKNRGSFGIFAR